MIEPVATSPGAWRTSVHGTACVLFVIAAVLAYRIGDLAPAHTGSVYIGFHVMMTVAMLGAWALGGEDRARLTLATGLIARLILIAAPMASSNDAERYLWDGAVVLAGLDPYAIAPADPQAAALRATWATPPEHAAYSTLYPPGALTMFALSALAGPAGGIWLWKAIAGAAGIATLLVTDRVLQRLKLRRHLPLVALSPILVLETGIGAHLDIFVALSIAVATLAFIAKRPVCVGIVLGLGAIVKLLPGAALLVFAIAAGRRDGARMVGAATVTVAATYGLACAIGWRPPGTLPVFFEKWRNGSPLFTLLEATLPGPLVLAVLAALAVALMTLAVGLARSRPLLAAQLALATPLLLSPVAFPWYLGALIPLAAAAPSAVVIAWISTAPLVYEVRDRFVSDGIWMPALWPLFAIGVAWLVGLGLDVARHRSCRPLETGME